MNDCICSLLTPPGRSAIATVGVAGKAVTDCVARFFLPAANRPLSAFPIGRIVFGCWHSGEDAAEELVVVRLAADRVDVHCHGGAFAAQSIMGCLESAGCRVVPWREFFAVEGTSMIETEARRALATAATPRTAGLLLAQLRGNLRRELTEVQRLVQENKCAEAQQILDRLAGRANVGLHLAEPWSVVLTGHVNVGKSSLINAIVGYERAIVYDQPGTTRDVVTALTAIEGWPVEFADTAGLRQTGDQVEAAGVQRARARLETADLVIGVFDRSQRWTDEDARLLSECQPGLIVHNKSDLPQGDGDWPAGLPVSAVTGQGIPKLVERIGHTLVPAEPAPHDGIPFTPHQQASIVRALQHLADGRIDEAQSTISTLLC